MRPDARFFPANAQVGKWLRSSPIEITAVAAGSDSSPSIAASPAFISISGTGPSYKSLGYLSAGNWICDVALSDNTNIIDATNFIVYAYGGDHSSILSSLGHLLVNVIAEDYDGSARLPVGDGRWSAVPSGEVFVEVTAQVGATMEHRMSPQLKQDHDKTLTGS